VTVKLTNSGVATASGKALYAPFQMRFRTAATSMRVPPVVHITLYSATTSNVLLNCQTTNNWNYQLQRRDTLDATSAWVNIGPYPQVQARPSGLTTPPARPTPQCFTGGRAVRSTQFLEAGLVLDLTQNKGDA